MVSLFRFNEGGYVTEILVPETDMVPCKICGKEYKVINTTHLRVHGLTQIEYLELYGYPVRKPFHCQDCFEVVHDATSANSVACDECARDRLLILRRDYQRNRRKEVRRQMMLANKEHGLNVVDSGSPYDQDVRIDATHSGWDVIPKLHKKLGTVTDYDLEWDEKGVRAMRQLRREMKKLKKN